MNAMKRYIPTLAVLAMVAFTGYHSVYFRKLSTMKSAQPGSFDAEAFAERCWSGAVSAAADSAVDLGRLIAETASGGAEVLERRTHALAIGNYRYAMIRVEGIVKQMDATEIVLSMPHADSSIGLRVALEYIYGNAIRDASASVQVRDLPNSSDLSAIAEALNRIARKRVVSAIPQDLRAGDLLQVTGAVELHRTHLRWQGLEIHPVRITRK
jgi:predicted lipoprotein